MPKKFNQILFLAGFCLGCFALFALHNVSTATAQTGSPDAIAIRILPNPEHRSPRQWYIDMGFKGSPQSITVDGYEGVRDGRTVYINVGNVQGNELRTYIYLISYNQEAADPTKDIFGKVLDEWQFNTNLPEVGQCNTATGIFCLGDDECPQSDRCLSQKARATRDVRRLSDLADIHASLRAYRAAKGLFPQLNAGSYLPHRTISAWPSWQGVLGNTLGGTIHRDPVNELGACSAPSFHPLTCWDEAAKSFDGTVPGAMPAGSLVYAYVAQDNENYRLCTLFETSYSNLAADSCVEITAGNQAPVIINADFPTGKLNEPYAGGIEAYDPNGDPLTFTLTLVSSFAGWTPPPGIQDLSIPNQRQVGTPRAGSLGYFTVTVTVRDSAGNTASQNYTFRIVDGLPPVINPIAPMTVTIGDSLGFTITAYENDMNYPLSFEVTGLPPAFASPISAVSNVANQHDFQLPPTTVVAGTRTYTASAIARDSFGFASMPRTFTVTVENDPPVFTSAPPASAVACVTNINYVQSATDPDGHTITYNLSGFPAGLSYNSGTRTLSGVVTAAPGAYTIAETATDQYAGFTLLPYSAAVSRTTTFTVIAETFAVTAPPAYDFYATPTGIDPLALYYGPFPYLGTAIRSPAGAATWSMSMSPNPSGINGLSAVINPASGLINISALDNAIPGSGYPFTLNITAATPGCGVTGSAALNLRVFPNAWCGDGAVQGAEGEICDDGNASNLDLCNTVCAPTSCGDGVQQIPNGAGQNENCDDGNTNQYDGCFNCSTAYCGNGVIESPEQCDDANGSNADLCNTNCQLTACGDGVQQTPNGNGQNEFCDDGNTNQYDGCSNACTTVYCGNGIVETGEQCDDANGSNADTCSPTCQTTVCGDGAIQSPNGNAQAEVCDDGNTFRYDGCSDDCRTVYCGNGIIESGEACDDANGTNSDLCNTTCQRTYCGDTVIQAPNGFGLSEQCDDGNAIPTDGCHNCLIAVCGNGVIEGIEQCDGSNLNGASCVSLGFTGVPPYANLACNASCLFNTAGCCNLANCVWGAWSAWSACTLSGTIGIQSQSRSVAVAAACGGAACSGASTQTQQCCANDCAWGAGQCNWGCINLGGGVPFLGHPPCNFGDGDDYHFTCGTCDADPCSELCQVTPCSGTHASDSNCTANSALQCVCVGGQVNCDGNWENGCETSIWNGDNNNCGACGAVCPTNDCSGGVCGAPPVLCGNGICDMSESSASCPIDCF